MPPIFITTAIDYVNGKPHIGHAVEKLQADVVARYWRGQGHDVFFLTGTDENSLSNVRAAQQNHVLIDKFVTTNATAFRALCETLNISLDDFIRTTEVRHVRGVQAFWRALRPTDLYQKDYTGLYCVGCEEFKLPKELVDGRCREHPHRTLDEVAETNYFFRLSAYQEQLLNILESDEVRITPAFRKNEVLAFIRGGLEDLSISRSVERAEHWGIRVPDDESQIMYVWVDALSSYITALGFADDAETYHRFWTGEGRRIHLIGKGIVRFHAVYWLAFLLSAGLPLPTDIFVHEYFTVNGQKMGKSLGNAIDPLELVARYGVDGTRYLLLSALPSGRDGDVTWAKLDEKYTADLSHGLGNLLQRTLVLRQKFGIEVAAGLAPSCAAADQATQIFHFDEALSEIWELVTHANRELEENAPWKESSAPQRAATLTSITRQLETIGRSLEPYLPEIAGQIVTQLETGQAIPLFPRLP